MKIIFMGTPEFALPSLKTLLNSRHQVIAVVTAPDKPAGRGKKLRFSAVKQAALEAGLPVMQPALLKEEGFVRQLRSFGADLFVVVAFRILPPPVFTMPPLGTINLHASLLPKYRGAAPISWAIMNGETTTGVTTFFIEEKVDTGQILLQRQTPIAEDMTAGELHDELAIVGAEVLMETVEGIDRETLKPVAQTGGVTAAPKLTPDLEQIDWSQSAAIIHNRIRGLSPIPGCHTYWGGKRLKILRSRVIASIGVGKGTAGEIVAVGKDGLLQVQTGAGTIALLELQPEGKRAMPAAEFLRGYLLKAGDVLMNRATGRIVQPRLNDFSRP